MQYLLSEKEYKLLDDEDELHSSYCDECPVHDKCPSEFKCYSS